MAVALLEHALDLCQPVYMRLAGGVNTPIIYKEQPEVRQGGSIVLREGTDVAILAAGAIVNEALKAAELLSQKGVEAKVVDMYSLKPIDKEQIAKCTNCRLMLTIEEHTIVGGLGSAVSEVLAENALPNKLLRLGVNDRFAIVGDYEYLLRQNRLTADLITEDVIKNL